MKGKQKISTLSIVYEHKKKRDSQIVILVVDNAIIVSDERLFLILGIQRFGLLLAIRGPMVLDFEKCVVRSVGESSLGVLSGIQTGASIASSVHTNSEHQNASYRESHFQTDVDGISSANFSQKQKLHGVCKRQERIRARSLRVGNGGGEFGDIMLDAINHGGCMDYGSDSEAEYGLDNCIRCLDCGSDSDAEDGSDNSMVVDEGEQDFTNPTDHRKFDLEDGQASLKLKDSNNETDVEALQEPYDGGYVSFGQGGGKITGKVAKASADESMLWYRRLGHLNFETMNKLVRHNLVKGLPSKCYENDHTCVACLKGKQHKASCKTKLVNSVSKPLHTLHMDLFGPTSVSSLNYKWNFITEIENLKDLKVKIIRVLVNKTQNKTPYELFNSRTPAIGFLRPFGCHVMILNTLDHLGKFDAKRDEGYFVGYSMSRKAFRVFNKRTKKLEENLHVDFLENKLIEKGAGPNWLFDIDTLTNSMNYVPVVVVGTSSTNISGTKDVASQPVKKDVSSLRYIALSNWFHEAHLESSNSNAQDACNVDAPESSGISNPTATSKIPPADQMETLTVESEIPTVSSPVLIACLDNSPETSSDSRLISKGVYSQEETPSLDNILTLSNSSANSSAGATQQLSSGNHLALTVAKYSSSEIFIANSGNALKHFIPNNGATSILSNSGSIGCKVIASSTIAFSLSLLK
nr:ribonuclease H-like domain-containing protein [Tanacetum cinerariifolium]